MGLPWDIEIFGNLIFGKIFGELFRKKVVAMTS